MMTANGSQVLIVGGGAIGGFYGSILHRGGAQVAVVSRSDYDQVRENGIQVSSRLGGLSFRPAAVLRNVEECPEPPDYLVLCVKVLEGIDRAALIRPAVGPATAIVLIENGIGIEDELTQAFPDNPLISALAFIGVSRIGPGRIEHKAFGHLVFGNYPSGAGEEAHRFSEWLQAGGIRTTVTESVLTERWRKCIWNAAFNPVSVLAGGADTATILNAPGGEALMQALMEELCAIAAAAGHPMLENRVEKILADTRQMPPYRTSMALDYLHGRPMEVEAILGNAVREGRRLDVPAPRLEAVYALMKMLEATTAGQESGKSE